MVTNSHINPRARRKKGTVDVDSLFKDLHAGQVSALSRAITLVESTASGDSAFAKAIIKQALPKSGKSFRLGITGVPGVGKSTFIEAIGKELIQRGKKVAVLAIDPSSNISRGSILGDKTRMEELVKSDQAFIRPSPAGTTLGGVARKTREAIILCEAAGYDFIIVETVGVGQSETAVHSMTDFFLLLKLAGAGDDLQGIKRGIMEMADAIIINKADGENQTAAKHARREFKNAVHLMPQKDHGWPTQVLTCSGLNGVGITEVIEEIDNYKTHATNNQSFNIKRNAQELYWFHQTIEDAIKTNFYNRPEVISKLAVLEKEVLSKVKSPFDAAGELLGL
ncbi:methylmalonyl Co-A mutase-associated GTPase MeaB [Nonlabens ulvanivorans]|uniref:methylmalonyl Co-A mutase-associated GTPase MeaB n=1 Tax=Nonlabens ulvanivorans TaxID=906888 RepID=UPI0029429BA5|nr:methylmalonyl Co-A mutase-associated GTPase MeaB [Nonlabens ulvanivorans]WOI23137.1 methylmalonyl Co-A mutase-associated GTPase MeaB [Nonlabens ulvanivorans]